MTNADPSKTEIDRLGVRLRESVSPDDLRLLDTYRLSFAFAYEEVLQAIKTTTGMDASGRPAKSTTAIVDKLSRESIRLSQMQGIAGCRIVVADMENQNTLASKLRARFVNAVISDRREKPSHGYRAIHIIVHHADRAVEIQIRTQLQHLWAEHSEKLADKFGIAVKYGSGPEDIRQRLEVLSKGIGFVEHLEANAVNTNPDAGRMILDNLKADVQTALADLLKTAGVKP